MNEAYDSARMDKLRELKRLLQELAAGGDEEMTDGDMSDVLAEADEAVEPEMGDEEPEVEVTVETETDPMAQEGELDPLAKMKRDYFKPKPKASRPGTAQMIAKAVRSAERDVIPPAVKRAKGKFA